MKEKITIFVIIMIGLNISLAANTMEVTRSSALSYTNNVELKTYDMKRIDLTNNVFGRLTVIKQVANNSSNKSQWECKCECGNTSIVTSNALRSGHTKSCGCLHKGNTKHNGWGTVGYSTWKGIKNRCYNTNEPRYDDYGGRGIGVSDEWRNSFAAFYNDMGKRPTLKHSIERRDNNKNYSKNNCYWATNIEQGNNKRNNVYYEIDGIKKTTRQWCIEYGVNYELVRGRLKRKWDIKRALTTNKIGGKNE